MGRCKRCGETDRDDLLVIYDETGKVMGVWCQCCLGIAEGYCDSLEAADFLRGNDHKVETVARAIRKFSRALEYLLLAVLRMYEAGNLRAME